MRMTFSSTLLASAPTIPSSWLTAIGNAKLLIAVWSSGLVVYITAILFWRMRRRDAALHASADAQPFATAPDDGQTITVSANKSRIAPYILRRTISTGVYAAFDAGLLFDPRFHWSVTYIVLSELFFGGILLFAAVHLLFAAVRYFSTAPILIVNAEGITDNATFMATGMGLIPWREISEVIVYNRTPSLRFLPTRTLTVVARNKTFMRQQAGWKRALHAFVPSELDVIRIREYLLPMPIEELRAQIEDYARAHGHTLRQPSWMPAVAGPAGPAGPSTSAD